MNLREQELKAVSQEFAIWQNKLGLLGALNLYDANIFAESLIADVLNVVFGHSLINANSDKANHPAIDLFDKKNRVAFQVTTTATSKKIQQTVNSFVDHHLEREYDVLYILILGEKQKKYPRLLIPSEISFTADKNVFDFKDLMKLISFLPTNRITQIKNILHREMPVVNNRKRTSPEARIRRNIALKKKLQKDFLMELPREHWEYSHYEPWIKFRYSNVILRDPTDKTFPEVSNTNNWLKAEFWDFYDGGIEFITQGGEAIFDKNGNWDILDYKRDTRRDNPEYSIVMFFIYPRLSFDNIATYDMEPDDYYSVPTIYCSFKFDTFPYEEIHFGSPGVYRDKLWRYLFDNDKRKKTGW